MTFEAAFTRELVDSAQFKGTQFSLLSWRTPQSTATTPFVWVVHGIGEHAARYDEVARYWNAKGLDVFAIDLPGHGHSKKEGKQTRCYAIEECATEVKDALRFLISRQKTAQTPWYLFAHSLGGLISLRLMMDHLQVSQDVPEPKRIFISAIPLKLRLHVPAWKEIASSLLLKVAPHFQLSNEIDPQMLSYNPDNIKAYKEDHFVHPFTSSWQYDSVKRASVDIIDDVKEFHTPIYMAVGVDDPIVDPTAISEFMEQLKCEKKFEMIALAKHETLNERNRVELFAKITDWFVGVK